jgi:hypothetical protein
LCEASRGVLAEVFDHRREEGLFRREVAVNTSFGYAGGGGDLAHCHRGVAFRLGEKLEGCLDQPLLGLPRIVGRGRRELALTFEEIG